MKAVMPRVDDRLLAARSRTGEDRWDEIWDGVLHMPPMPNNIHQLIEGQLETWLRIHWEWPGGGTVYHQVNLASPGGWPNVNFRVPDLLLASPDQGPINRVSHFEGPPLVVVEIRSPDDESYEKLPFYAALGVPEAWIIDRDTLRPEIYQLRSGTYLAAAANQDGWILSPATSVELRGTQDERLNVRIAARPETAAVIPRD